MPEMYTPAQVKIFIHEDAEFIGRAIIMLYNLQEQDEQVAKVATYQNKVGFNAADAKFLSEVAVMCADKAHETGEEKDFAVPVTHLEEARRRLLKYSQQLSDIIDDTFWEPM